MSAAETDSKVFTYGRFTCEKRNIGYENVVAIVDYDGSYTTEPLVFPEVVECEGVQYKVVSIDTDKLLTGRYVPEKVIIPGSVTSVGRGAFQVEGNNTVTKDIEFGENVDWIGEKACYGYTSNVHMKAKIPPFLESSDAFLWTYSGTTYIYGNPNIFVPLESLADYRTSEWWSGYKDNIFAIGSFNFISLDDFYFSDGMEVNTIKRARIEFVNDTGLEIKSFRGFSSDPDMLYAVADEKTEYEYWYTIVLQSFAETGVVTVTAVAELEDGSIREQEYKLEIRGSSSITGLYEVPQSHTEVYSLEGRKVAESVDGLDSGIYLVREGDKVRKIMVR